MPESFRAIAVRLAAPIVVLAIIYWALTPRSVSTPGAATTAAIGPDEARGLVDRAAVLVREGRDEEARVVLTKLYKAYPNNHVYARQLAQIAGRLGKFEDETRYWEDFVRLSPTPWEACPRMGEAYWKRGLTKESIAAYDRCLGFGPDEPDNVFYLARAYEWSQRYDEARKLYEKGIDLDGNYLDMYLGLSRIELHRGHVREARAGGFRILERDPENVDALLVIGLSYQREGNRRDARKYLEQGVRLADAYTDFHLALGVLEEEDKHPREAIEHYDRALTLDATNRDARRRRELLAAHLK